MEDLMTCTYCGKPWGERNPDCFVCNDSPGLGELGDPNSQPLEPWLEESDD